MKIIIILLSTIILGCSNTQEFKSPKDIVFNGKRFIIGDILIKERDKKFLSWWGHSSIVVKENIIGDFPKFGEKYYEINIQDWVEKDRKVLVLRYKNNNLKFQKALLKNIEKYKNNPYSILLNKENENGFYCSKFIWFIYKKTAEEFGIDLDIDYNKGWIVFPYDFINSESLIKINLYKTKKGESKYEKSY